MFFCAFFFSETDGVNQRDETDKCVFAAWIICFSSSQPLVLTFHVHTVRSNVNLWLSSVFQLFVWIVTGFLLLVCSRSTAFQPQVLQSFTLKSLDHYFFGSSVTVVESRCLRRMSQSL